MDIVERNDKSSNVRIPDDEQGAEADANPPPLAEVASVEPSPDSKLWHQHEHTIVVLQGGGALGAYQAGVCTGLEEAGMHVDWVAGVSIGALNAALIAGNPPGRRVERLREFWDRVSAHLPFTLPSSLTLMRPMANRANAASVVAFGVPGFFVPRTVPPMLATEGTTEALSYYDTQPLKATLEELVDFDFVNSKQVRLSLGAVNVRTGNSQYFDNTKMRLRPEHVMASGALPPGFPPVNIDGDFYWDGGIVSNSPLSYVADEAYDADALVFQIDLFSGAGEVPRNLDQVNERVKDIQYSSKTRFNSARLKEFEELRARLHRVLEKLPEALQSDPDVQKLKAVSTRGAVTLVHFINRHDTYSSHFKDAEFSRATVTELWEAGQSDVRHAIAHPEWRRLTDLGHGMRVYDITR
jgi:NTE family protein